MIATIRITHIVENQSSGRRKRAPHQGHWPEAGWLRLPQFLQTLYFTVDMTELMSQSIKVAIDPP